MIRKNIDVVAIAVLLAVMALYSEARKLAVLEVVPNHGIVLANHIVQTVWGCVPDVPLPPAPSLVFSN